MYRLRTGLLLSAIFLSLNAFGARNPAKQDTSWKRYVNKDVGYCVSFPARWVREEAFDGAGMYFETGLRKFSMPIGELDIAASPAPDELSDIVDLHLQGLKKFERAQEVEVLDRREVQFLDTSALLTKDRYFDPQDRHKWVNEILLARHNKLLYRLELVCRADQLERFDAVFSRFVKTFKFECNAKH
ncbi:MAG: hypothetical protein M3Y57_08135 [Acidobacteriota bacterium]|nr:hypothetical protein [Acidobacteriota bacterium]